MGGGKGATHRWALDNLAWIFGAAQDAVVVADAIVPLESLRSLSLVDNECTSASDYKMLLLQVWRTLSLRSPPATTTTTATTPRCCHPVEQVRPERPCTAHCGLRSLCCVAERLDRAAGLQSGQ
eukprot:SAG11_NODE_243_length_11749_cov_33.422918_5_plen_124_part_00